MDRFDTMAHDHTIKDIIIGDKGCGKSCFLHHFTQHKCMSCLLLVLPPISSATTGTIASACTRDSRPISSSTFLACEASLMSLHL